MLIKEGKERFYVFCSVRPPHPASPGHIFTINGKLIKIPFKVKIEIELN